MGNAFGNGMELRMGTVLGPLLTPPSPCPIAQATWMRVEEPEGGGSEGPLHDQSSTWDAMETYFECITTCSLEDGECVTRCVEELREKA